MSNNHQNEEHLQSHDGDTDTTQATEQPSKEPYSTFNEEDPSIKKTHPESPFIDQSQSSSRTVEEHDPIDRAIKESLDREEEAEKYSGLPLLELRNNVFFPGITMPIVLNRKRGQQLVRDLQKHQGIVAIVTQMDPKEETPSPDSFYRIGVRGKVRQVITSGVATPQLVVQGLDRIRIDEFVATEPYMLVNCSRYPDENIVTGSSEDEVFFREISNVLNQYVKKSSVVIKDIGNGILQSLNAVKSKSLMLNLFIMQLNQPTQVKQTLLELDTFRERAATIISVLGKEMAQIEIREEIDEKVKDKLSGAQREMIIHQMIEALREEIDEGSAEDDVTKFRALGKKLKLSEQTQAFYDREVNRLNRMNPMAPDYAVQVSYLQLFVDLPWGIYSKDKYDLNRAQKILDTDHYGLEQVKERIIEHLAVLKVKKDLKSPIICLYGPPGVGKTSLGKSIAKALGRQYARISLGGMHDESEIRGHRRTYIGSMPGRIIQNLRKVKTSNPVFILDEIDKVTSNVMGDPASALLEVLDPEQNSTFADNYLEVDFDLSHVLFITTANDISAISPALRDRMEMIEVTGYLAEEKVQIAKRHLLPEQLKQHGLKSSQLKIDDEVLRLIIDEYTRESGVRKLNQLLAKLVRYRTRQVAMEEPFKAKMSLEEVSERLGASHYDREIDRGTPQIGVAVGMAWTQVGGETLYVETSVAPGNGELTLTGNLGKVMQESAKIALAVVRARASRLGIDPQLITKSNIHVHVPDGAIPKDGPSAGVTMITAITSAFKRQAPRTGIAMTGEVTLTGKVQPVGGIKEKILAAKRARINKIVLPAGNAKDVHEIKPEYIEGLEFIYIKNVDELFAATIL